MPRQPTDRAAIAAGKCIVDSDIEGCAGVLGVPGQVAAAALRVVQPIHQFGGIVEALAAGQFGHEAVEQDADDFRRDRAGRLAPADRAVVELHPYQRGCDLARIDRTPGRRELKAPVRIAVIRSQGALPVVRAGCSYANAAQLVDPEGQVVARAHGVARANSGRFMVQCSSS